MATVWECHRVRSDWDLDVGAAEETPELGTRQQVNEASAVLIGHQSNLGWLGQLTKQQPGDPASVEFDWAWVLEREEKEGDVIGFYHTHPGGLASPSPRDVRTMRAWVSCFGKPLLCLVEGGSELSAYLFETDEDDGQSVSGVRWAGSDIVVNCP